MDVSMELLMMMQTDKFHTHHHHHKPHPHDTAYNLPYRPNASHIAPSNHQSHFSTSPYVPYTPPYSTFPQMSELEKQTSMAAMREMIFRIAAMQPVQIDPEAIKPPKRKNVKISKDPQSVAARHRREKISEKIRILQRLVPGGTKMDTASMLDEAIHYVKFLKKQVQSLERGVAVGVGIGGDGLMVDQSGIMMGSVQQMMC